MIAAWPMYDRPELHEANDRFWAEVAVHLERAPTHLTRDMDLWDIWQAPDLLMAQTCGYPFRARLHDKVTYVTTPDFGLPDCPPGYYNSVLIARQEGPDTLAAFDRACFAYNEALSQSGWSAPMQHCLDQGVTPHAIVETGAHVASARAVADGRADFAGIDHRTWQLIQKFDDWSTHLKVIDATSSTPALPIICSKNQDPTPIRLALDKALEALDTTTRILLGIQTFVQVPKQAYLDVRTPLSPREFTAKFPNLIKK